MGATYFIRRYLRGESRDIQKHIHGIEIRKHSGFSQETANNLTICFTFIGMS